MFWRHLLALIFSWGLFKVSERVIPAIHSSLSLSNDWWTLLFFRPFHVVVAVISFLTAILLIRLIMLKQASHWSGGKALNRVGSLSLMIIACGILVQTAFRHLVPTILVSGCVLLYDIVQIIGRGRRNKRLKAVLRQH